MENSTSRIIAITDKPDSKETASGQKGHRDQRGNRGSRRPRAQAPGSASGHPGESSRSSFPRIRGLYNRSESPETVTQGLRAPTHSPGKAGLPSAVMHGNDLEKHRADPAQFTQTRARKVRGSILGFGKPALFRETVIW